MKITITIELSADDTRTDDEVIADYLDDPNEFFNGSEWIIQRSKEKR